MKDKEKNLVTAAQVALNAIRNLEKQGQSVNSERCQLEAALSAYPKGKK